MRKSNDINELLAALAKAQGKLTSIPFDSKNPHFGNQFASLTAIQDMTRPILSEFGLSITQILETEENGANWLHTMLGHSSGQYIQSSIKLLVLKNDMQSLGSATTYAKRYAWQAIIGVSGDQDDDGEAAVRPGNKPVQQKAPARAAGTDPRFNANPNAVPKEVQQVREQNAKAEAEAQKIINQGVTRGPEMAPASMADKVVKNHATGENVTVTNPVIEPAAAATSKPEDDYKVTFGRYSGLTLKAIGATGVQSTLEWVSKDARRPLSPNMVDFMKHAKVFLNQ